MILSPSTERDNRDEGHSKNSDQNLKLEVVQKKQCQIIFYLGIHYMGNKRLETLQEKKEYIVNTTEPCLVWTSSLEQWKIFFVYDEIERYLWRRWNFHR